jgi:hypothetical protein
MHDRCRTVLGWDRGMQKRTNKTELAGWVARTRPLAEPLSPRGPQPVGLQNAVPV